MKIRAASSDNGAAPILPVPMLRVVVVGGRNFSCGYENSYRRYFLLHSVFLKIEKVLNIVAASGWLYS